MVIVASKSFSPQPPSRVRAFLVHLRIPFQLALAPFFLLGSWCAQNDDGGAFVWFAVFILVHVGLYGGATVYNSYYDKDNGPIGMLKKPPPVPRPLLYASLALQGVAVVGIAVLARGGLRAGVLAFAMMALGVGYSHPHWRWKGRAVAGLAVVTVGQGLFAVLLGHQAATAAWPDAQTLATALAASVVVLGLYPLTQIYQIDEDGARGDMTMPVRYGWRRTMVFASGVTGTGVVLLVISVRTALPAVWPVGLAAALIGLAVYVAAWWRRFEGQAPERNHDWAMTISIAVALPLGAALGLALWQAWA